MQSRSATIRLIMEASRMLHETVGVLSNPEHGVAMRASGTTGRIVALLRTRVASSRLELVSWPSRLVAKIKSLMMSDDQG